MVTSEVREEPKPPRRSRLAGAGWWVLGLTFVAVLLMIGGHALQPRLELDEGVGYVAACGFGLSALLFALGFLHALFSVRTRGAGAAFVGLCVCGFLGVGSFAFTSRAEGMRIDAWRRAQVTYNYDPGQPQTYLGRYLRPPSSDFERDFFSERDRADWLEQAFGEAMPPLRLVRTGTALSVQYPRSLGARQRGRVALAVQRLVDLDLRGTFEPATLPLDDSDWEFQRHLTTLPRRN
jgi:hypothetical protein